MSRYTYIRLIYSANAYVKGMRRKVQERKDNGKVDQLLPRISAPRISGTQSNGNFIRQKNYLFDFLFRGIILLLVLGIILRMIKYGSSEN